MSTEETDQQPAAPATPAPQAAPAPQPAPMPQGQQVQQVQYVVNTQSLEGLEGWLIGWLLYLGVCAIAGISTFFNLLQVGSVSSSYRSSISTSADNIRMVSLLFLPFVAICAIATIVLIAQRKKLGVKASLAFIALSGAYSLILALVGSSGQAAAAVAGGICTTAVICTLQALYFFQSKRVKATLIK